MNDRTDEAVRLFKQVYGKTPTEAGFPMIAVYEKQHAFLYATTEKIAQAYKTQQNILRWILKWYMLPIAIIMIYYFAALFRYQDVWNWQCLSGLALLGVYWIFTIGLGIKVWLTSKYVKLGKTVTYLNYET